MSLIIGLGGTNGTFVPERLQSRLYILSVDKDYNGFRPHMSCHDLTPNQMHRQRKLLVVKWIEKTEKKSPKVGI